MIFEMFLLEYLTIIVIIFLNCIMISYCECTFQLYKDMDPHFQPVYFIKDEGKKSFELATQKLIDTRNYIKIDESQTLIITCPNAVHQQERYYEIDIFLVCGADNELMVTEGADKIPVNTEVNEYKCKHETGFYFKKESHKRDQKLCKSFGKSYTLHYIGLYTYMWFTLYSVCHCTMISTLGKISSVYTHHTINEEIVKNRQMKSTKYGDKDMRNPFKDWQSQHYMFHWYNKEVMWGTINKNYDGKLNSYINVENHHFVPIALVPEDAMSFSSWRYATHLSPNIVPVWKQVSCTWKNIENVVKLAAIRIGSTLDIYTGTFKVLQLPTSVKDKEAGGGTRVKLGTSSSFNSVAVPEILWKLIFYEEKNEAIIFIVHNNPYRTDRVDVKKSYCTNICKKYGWQVENEVIKLGETSCCDPREFFGQNQELAPYKNFFNIEKVLALPNSKLETESD